jgi:hypothetical protein
MKRQIDADVCQIIGIDGEAWSVGPEDKERGREHIYGLLLAADEKGKKWSVSNAGKRLTTKQCLDFVLSLPDDAFIIGFSFKYDLTKMLEDLPDSSLYKLNHTSSASEERGVNWDSGNGKPYHLEYLGSKFIVSRGSKTRTIWDLFKFYQTSFVKTMKLWKIEDDLALIEQMKEKRSDFDISQLPEIAHYCFLECRNLSRLGRKLLNALRSAKLDLEGQFYGAGSVGGAVLKRMGAEEESAFTKQGMPEEMHSAVIRAFFGGRFEISRSGPVRQPCWEYDISSAYPYQIYQIPCLRHTCGKWVKTDVRADLDSVDVALVHYDLSTPPKVHRGWGPFPYRTSKGTSTYPSTSGGGWVWLQEYLNGERLFDNVKFVEAWVWKRSCDCHHPNPFREIAELYKERCRLGKGEAGIIIKLGYNAGYGKFAQSVGRAIYNNWAWAGMITSGCRAQLLHMIGLHKDWNNILMVATDGIYTTESLEPPLPIDTGTGPDKLVDENGNPKNAPLGGWEKSKDEELSEGLFLARPGVYFSLKLKDKAPKIKCRGIGLKTLADARVEMVDFYERTGGSEPFEFMLNRFHGMKTSTGKKHQTASLIPIEVEEMYYRRPYYGRWKTSAHKLSFSPLPKRAEGFACRALPDPELLEMSRPYSKALAMAEDDETKAALLDADSLAEQPDLEDNG